MSDSIKCKYDGDPLIPEEEYNVKCIKSEIKSSPWGFKLRLDFQIISGKYNSINLVRYYNMKSSKKTNPDGEIIWKNGSKSDYIRDYRRLFGKTNGNYDPSIFENKCLLIEVTTVKQDSKKREIGEVNHYSKVDYIISEINCQENIEVNWA
jgi:hypothetical protein